VSAAVQRWKDHWSVYKKLDTKPVLFIMAEKNVYADALGKYLWKELSGPLYVTRLYLESP
jgi:hypothetical protein